LYNLLTQRQTAKEEDEDILKKCGTDPLSNSNYYNYLVKGLCGITASKL